MPEKFATCECTVRFLTPAFLGSAFQQGQWRTPPFKALLRQWWRVAYAASCKYKVNVLQMRQLEGKLFGNAWLEKEKNGRPESDASRSLVRLRVSAWKNGSLQSWQNIGDPTVRHPEVPQPVGAHLYLGYGPLVYERGARRTGLKSPPSIQAGESAELRLAFPTEHGPALLQTLRLIHSFGAVGGRSRNGWGSLWLAGPQWSDSSLPLRNWREALDMDWPHCIGQDEKGPLIWITAAESEWKSLMKTLAEIKIALRTQFPFPANQQGATAQPLDRHWLSYPVTNHPVGSWGNQARLPNSLRLRVRPAPDNPNQLVGVIFHMPCLPPPAFNPKRDDIIRVWQRVHQFLDEHPQLQRAKE